MKGYLLLLIISISGCSTQFATRKEFIPYAYDFTPYSAKGFLFTPLELIDRPYDGRGMIHIDGFPEVKAITEMVAYESGQVSPKQKLVPGRVDASEMIEQAYQMAIGMGADVIIFIPAEYQGWFVKRECSSCGFGTFRVCHQTALI